MLSVLKFIKYYIFSRSYYMTMIFKFMNLYVYFNWACKKIVIILAYNRNEDKVSDLTYC